MSSLRDSGRKTQTRPSHRLTRYLW